MSLFDRYALCKISWLVYIVAAGNGNMISEKLLHNVQHNRH